jgi:GMP synthase-like glutamine amidotransferase
MRILVIQHESEAPAGVVGEALDAAGAERVTVKPMAGEALPGAPDGFAGALLLGGPMSVAGDDTHPHYRALFRLVRGFHDEGRPIFGICLGAQILARSLESRVYPQGGTEFGFQPVELTPAALADPLFAGLGPSLRPMQWHEDSFDLPKGAVLLAENAFCRNQAYRMGDLSYGVQFHPEVNRRVLTGWVGHPAAIQASGWTDVARRMEDEMDRHLERAMALGRTLAGRWMGLVRRRWGKAAA